MSKNGQFNIETLKKNIEKEKAKLGEADACLEETSSGIEGLAASIAEAEDELKNATLIRDKEKADFEAAEAELMEAIDVLERAIAILEREMAKNPALVQVDSSNFKALLQSLDTVIDAAAFSRNDKQKLLALVQAQQSAGTAEDAAEEATEAQLGAPDPAAYKSHSKGIVEVLEDMLEKAKADLAELRKAEGAAQHNYDMLKLALDDEMAANKKNMAEAKDKKNQCEIDKADAEADLASLTKELAEAEEGLATAQATCMQVAADHEVTVKSRAEELKALAEAKKILMSTTPGAEEQTYSLLQMASGSRLGSRADLASMEVVTLIKRLAKQHHSAALAQLASKISIVMRYGAAGGDDPFAKVKGLIKELIDRLLAEAQAEATEKAYCDEQMAKTEAKKAELEDEIAKLTAKIDKAAAMSAMLKEEVKELQAELAELAKMQAEMDKTRQEEHEAFVKAKADLEAGLAGVRKALDVLRSYYGGGDEEDVTELMQQPPIPEKHAPAAGAGGGIIDILEVVESDFAKNLAEEETEEADAQAQYEKITQENKIKQALKEQDVKYKTQEFKALDKAISEYTSDKDLASEELTSVLEYYEKIKERCIAKPETYEERKKRREAEIAGLKEALAILEGEAALVQKGSRSGVLRR